MDSVFGRFLLKQAAAAVLGFISTIVVLGVILFIQNNYMGGVLNAGVFLFIGWGVSWNWWFSTICFFMDHSDS